MLNGDLETEIRNAVKAIYPCKNVVIRKSQLLQSGVVTDKGPTLDEIHEEEARQDAELKAKKAAAIEKTEEDDDQSNLLAAAEAMESISEKGDAPVESEDSDEPEEEPAVEEVEVESSDESEETDSADGETEADLMKLKKDELVEKAKEAGVATSGTKADIVARLLE